MMMIRNTNKRYCNVIVIIAPKYSSPKNEPVLADIYAINFQYKQKSIKKMKGTITLNTFFDI